MVPACTWLRSSSLLTTLSLLLRLSHLLRPGQHLKLHSGYCCLQCNGIVQLHDLHEEVHILLRPVVAAPFASWRCEKPEPMKTEIKGILVSSISHYMAFLSFTVSVEGTNCCETIYVCKTAPLDKVTFIRGLCNFSLSHLKPLFAAQVSTLSRDRTRLPHCTNIQS